MKPEHVQNKRRHPKRPSLLCQTRLKLWADVGCIIRLNIPKLQQGKLQPFDGISRDENPGRGSDRLYGDRNWTLVKTYCFLDRSSNSRVVMMVVRKEDGDRLRVSIGEVSQLGNIFRCDSDEYSGGIHPHEFRPRLECGLLFPLGKWSWWNWGCRNCGEKGTWWFDTGEFAVHLCIRVGLGRNFPDSDCYGG